MAWLRVMGVVCLSLGSVAAAGSQRAPRALPPTVQVDPNLGPTVARLLERSATFRRQCEAIARAPGVRVEVRLVPRFPSSLTRAKATVNRYEYGRMAVLVEIAAGGDYAELLAHEFEHVTEQIDRVDLAALARSKAGGAARVSEGAYETVRAIEAGRAAAAEADGALDPAVRTAGNGLARAARTTWRRLGQVEAVAPDPTQFHRK
jgi:hypothetical protein